MINNPFLSLVAIAALAVTTACESVPETGQPLVGTVKRIDVSQHDESMTFSGSMARPMAEQDMLDFLDRAGANGQQDILFAWHQYDAVSGRMVSHLGRQLQELGYRHVYYDPKSQLPQPGQISLILRSYRASVPGCDIRDTASHYANGPMPGFGCASLQNLAQMVADPRDLIRGRALGRIQAAELTIGYQRILADDPKPLIGGITEIGETSQ